MGNWFDRSDEWYLWMIFVSVVVCEIFCVVIWFVVCFLKVWLFELGFNLDIMRILKVIVLFIDVVCCFSFDIGIRNKNVNIRNMNLLE